MKCLDFPLCWTDVKIIQNTIGQAISCNKDNSYLACHVLNTRNSYVPVHSTVEIIQVTKKILHECHRKIPYNLCGNSGIHLKEFHIDGTENPTFYHNSTRATAPTTATSPIS